jgi:outer membrane protein assembly factor BamB
MRRVIAFILLASAMPILGADWPQWLGTKRDAHSPEKISWNENPTQVWKMPVGEGNASPVIANGVAYLHTRVDKADGEQLSAFDAKTGDLKWVKSYERAKANTKFGTGPRATPTIDRGVVFTFGITGVLSAFKADDGNRLWQVDIQGQDADLRGGGVTLGRR